MTASSAKVRSVKNIARLRFSIGILLRNKMSNLEWSQCDARPIRDLPDSRIGAGTEEQDKVNCHHFVQNAHRQQMQRNCFRCSVHGRRVTVARLCLRGCRGRAHGCGAASVLRGNYGGKGHREIRRMAAEALLGNPEPRLQGQCLRESPAFSSCDHRVHQPTRT